MVPGDRVVVVLPNRLEFVYAWFGLALARAITVPVNPRAAEAELGAVVAEVRPRLVVTGTGGATPPPGVGAADVDDLLAAAPAEAEPAPALPDDPVTYIQSSGSTGRPKFVIETSRMYTLAAEGFPFWLGLGEDDVLLTPLPLSHLNAQAYSTLGSYGCGAQLALLPRFSATMFWDEVASFTATQFNAIGAMLEILMSRLPSPAERSHRVRLCYSAPAPAAPYTVALVDQALESLVLLRSPMELGDAGATVSALVSLIAEADGRLPDAVADARDQGYTWDEIASRLATTVATARRRYAAYARRRTPLDLD